MLIAWLQILHPLSVLHICYQFWFSAYQAHTSIENLAANIEQYFSDADLFQLPRGPAQAFICREKLWAVTQCGPGRFFVGSPGDAMICCRLDKPAKLADATVIAEFKMSSTERAEWTVTHMDPKDWVISASSQHSHLP